MDKELVLVLSRWILLLIVDYYFQFLITRDLHRGAFPSCKKSNNIHSIDLSIQCLRSFQVNRNECARRDKIRVRCALRAHTGVCV